MRTLNFRIAQMDDAGAIAQLVNEAYRPKTGDGGWTHESDLVSGNRTNTEQVESLIKQENSVVLLGLHGTTVVACVHTEKDGTSANIGMLAVSPTLQGAGAGKEVLAFAEAYTAKNFGSENFAMVVVAERTELISFYLRRGYEKTGNMMEYPLGTGVGTPKFNTLKIEVLHKKNPGQRA